MAALHESADTFDSKKPESGDEWKGSDYLLYAKTTLAYISFTSALITLPMVFYNQTKLTLSESNSWQ